MKKYLSILFLTLLTALLNAQVSKTIHLSTAGTLSSLLSPNEKATITDLVVTGSIDARDVKCMRDEMTVLAVLDLSAVRIMAYKGENGTMLGQPVEKQIYPADEMPFGSFFLMASQGKESLKTIYLPYSIISIGEWAFDGCKGLTSIVIPESVTSIKDYAFNTCTQLTTIRCLNSTPPTLGFQCFYIFNTQSYTTSLMNPNAVYIPVGSITAYKAATGWSDFKRMSEYILTVTTKDVELVDSSTVILNANIDLITDSPVTAHGFCWNTTGSPTTADTKIDNGLTAKTGEYSNKLADLHAGVTYYLRAFATDGNDTVYGNQVEFKTVYSPSEAGIITGDTSVCQGEQGVTYTVPAIDHATTYIWTLPDGAIGTSTTNSITVYYSKSARSGNITVFGRNENGRGNGSFIPITVNPLPNISFTTMTVNCGETILDASISYAGTDTLTYLWTPVTGLNDATIANPVAKITRNITYTLTATTSNGCSSTGYVQVQTLPMDQPQIGIVSVNNSNKNMVVWNKPESTGIDYYTIYRETNTSDIYEKIGNVSYSDLSVFVDSSSTPDIKSNKYKLSIVDASGVESPLSDPHKTMHLTINKGQNNTWNLIWEPYFGFTPSSYTIYRGTNASDLTLLDATSGSSNQYSDIHAPTGDVYYQLEVNSPYLTTPSQLKSYSQKSNVSAMDIMVSYNSSRSNIATNKIINPDAENDDIEAYPNPVKDQLTINQVGHSTFEIIDLFGRVVYHGILNDKTIVPTSNLSSGIYLLKIGKAFKRILKN